MRMFSKVIDFELPGHTGQNINSKDYRGRYIILYFYPKASTPGCTREAKDFSGRMRQFEKLDSVVFGVSPDQPRIQARFIESESLAVTMLSDSELKLAQEFGVVKDGKRIVRSTFLIDRTGVVRSQWKGVRVEGHVEEVLQVLRQLYQADHELNPIIAVRRARRALSTEPIPEEDLTRIVEAAHLAPSCFNNQPWRFVIAQGESLEAVKDALPDANYWAKRAPAIIAVSSHRDLDCKLSDGRDYFLFCCGLAVENLVLQATQMGFIAHPIAGYRPVEVKEALHIPQEYVLITLVIVGKPGDIDVLNEKHREVELSGRDRKPLDAVLAWNRFSFVTETE